MRRIIFLSAFAFATLLGNVAAADDSATAFALKPVDTKDLGMHSVHPFFPLRPGNFTMNTRPLMRMSPPAAPVVSMSNPATPPLATGIKKPHPVYQKTAAEPGFQPVLKDKPGAESSMSKEQAQQILSLFSSNE